MQHSSLYRGKRNSARRKICAWIYKWGKNEDKRYEGREVNRRKRIKRTKKGILHYFWRAAMNTRKMWQFKGLQVTLTVILGMNRMTQLQCLTPHCNTQYLHAPLWLCCNAMWCTKAHFTLAPQCDNHTVPYCNWRPRTVALNAKTWRSVLSLFFIHPTGNCFSLLNDALLCSFFAHE